MTTLALKIIAVVSMFIDHSGAVLFPDQMWMRYVGRLAFPIYAFLISEGYIHTHDLKRYIMRLGIFALISEVPFDLAFEYSFFYTDYQNVFFTLLLGILAIMLIDCFDGQIFWQCLSVACMCLAAGELQSDYRYVGVALIVIFYLYRDRPVMRAVGAALALTPFLSSIEWVGLLALIPITFYNGKPGRYKWRWFFYIFYPAHLTLLVCIRRIVTGTWI